MVTKEQIDGYLHSKTNAWAESTKTSERNRLNSVAHLIDGRPDNLWAGIRPLGAYSRLTTWTRVVDFYGWLKPDEPNPYEVWRRVNAKVFKNVYEKKKPSISYEEAAARIETLAEPHRSKARQLLTGGLRFTESNSQRDGRVVGKGGKVREVYCLPSGQYRASYQTFRRSLASVGLKPHDLRKIFLSKLAPKVNQYELCEIAGWSSIATASSYIAVDKTRLKNLVKEATQV